MKRKHVGVAHRKHVKLRRYCRACSKRLVHAGTGRPKVYCGPACRQSAHAARKKAKDSHFCDWWAPPVVRDWVLARFRVGLDAAASAESCLVPAYLGLDDGALMVDALRVPDWAAAVEPGSDVYCNPPYSPSSVLVGFVERAVATAAAGVTVVMLIPYAADTAWWERLVVGGGALFVNLGRLAFDGPRSVGQPARRSSALVVWPGTAIAQEELEDLRRLVRGGAGAAVSVDDEEAA
jgi:hypothetical protein